MQDLSAGFNNSATCIGQQNPHFTQPGAIATYQPFSFDTESNIDRYLNPLAPPNDFMDALEDQCDDCEK